MTEPTRMFDGTVSFMAKMYGNGLTFPLFDFAPNEPGVVRVELEGSNGDEIRGTVHLASVSTEEAGRALARKVLEMSMNNIAFCHQVAIGDARSISDSFSPTQQEFGVHTIAISEHLHMTGTVHAVLGVSGESLRRS